jgi:Bacterial regulatory protein, Fis family
MVVLLVGIPGVEAGTLPGATERLQFFAVDSLAEALVFLDERSCDAVLVGSGVRDMAQDPLGVLSRRSIDEANGSASMSSISHDERSAGSRGRDDVVEKTFRRGSIRDMERLMILDRLARLNQNRTRSAESLEISVRTLRNKLRDYRTTPSAPPLELALERESG